MLGTVFQMAQVVAEEITYRDLERDGIIHPIHTPAHIAQINKILVFFYFFIFLFFYFFMLVASINAFIVPLHIYMFINVKQHQL